MQVTELRIPFALLSDPSLTASAKLVWMALAAMRQCGARLHIKQVAKLIGISDATAYTCVQSIKASEWGSVLGDAKSSAPLGPHIRFPTDLIMCRELSPNARLLYGFLQGTQRYRRRTCKGETSIAELARLARTDLKTVRLGLAQLAAFGWLATSQANQKAPIRFTLIDPAAKEVEEELARVQRQLNEAEFLGEGLMRALLSLLVALDDYEDDASPGYLVNPLTGKLLQFDRFYPPNVAFEFNGPQHYRATELYSAENAREQRTRDLIKIGICAEKGVTLIIVHPEDLSIAAMRGKIGELLPMRDLTRLAPVARYLEARCRSYRQTAGRRRLG